MSDQSLPPPEPRPVLLFPAPESKASSNVPARQITRDELVSYQEDQLVQNATKVVPRMFRALMREMRKGNTKAIEQAAQIYGYIKSTPGITFNLQNNTYNEAAKSSMYFEGVIRGLEVRDRPDGNDDDIIDAEVVEDE